MKIENLVFDMGNVLTRLTMDEYIRKHTNSEEEADIIRKQVRNSLEWVWMDRGVMSDEEAISSISVRVPVTGPDGEAVTCSYGILKRADSRTAVMEMAAAAGITLVHERDPLRATTRGVGEMIADAIGRGIRDFIIGIVGDFTTECGPVWKAIWR